MYVSFRTIFSHFEERKQREKYCLRSTNAFQTKQGILRMHTSFIVTKMNTLQNKLPSLLF